MSEMKTFELEDGKQPEKALKGLRKSEETK